MTQSDRAVYEAIAAGRPVDDEAAVARLVRLGLVDATVPSRLVALDPRIAAHQLHAKERVAIRQATERMAAVERDVESLAQLYEPQRMYGAAASELLPSKKLMNERIGEVMAGAASELLTLQPGEPASRDPEVLRAGVRKSLGFLERGLCVRTIYASAALAHQQTGEYVEAVTAAGGEVRIGASLPPRMVIVDRRHLFVDNHVVPSEPNSGWHIGDVASVAWACSVFERAWAMCTPWERAQGAMRDAVTTARQRDILRRLEAGDTVETAATALHVSTRVVNKDLAALRSALSLPSTFAVMAWWGGCAERGLP